MTPSQQPIQMTTVAAQMPLKLRTRLEKIGDADDRKLSYVIRKACEEYVERYDLRTDGEANGGAA